MRRPYYRRDRRRWYVKTDDGNSQIYLGETKAEAYAVWESMRRQGEPGRWRIAELAAAFLADAEARGVSKSYLHSCRFALGKLAAAFPAKLAADLRPSDVTAWIARQATWGDWQRGHVIQAIRSAWRFGVGEGHLGSNPFMALRKPMGRRKESAITAEEHWRLLLACRCWDECAFIHALWLTGARPAELTQATAADDAWRADHSPPPWQSLADAEQVAAITRRAFGGDLLRRRYLVGESVVDIAASLGVHSSAIDQRLRRAIAEIRAEAC